jgi:hypothetical protein
MKQAGGDTSFCRLTKTPPFFRHTRQNGPGLKGGFGRLFFSALRLYEICDGLRPRHSHNAMPFIYSRSKHLAPSFTPAAISVSFLRADSVFFALNSLSCACCRTCIMEFEEPATSFKHDKLPDSATHIRLLRVKHCVENQQLACQLSTRALKRGPCFFAISYTWGDPCNTTEITIDDQTFKVRQNCESVLRQAFGVEATAYFWIDAICIDQEEDQENPIRWL